MLDALVGDAAQAVVRILMFAGVIGMIGGLLFDRVLAPAFTSPAARDQAKARALHLMRWSAVLLSIALGARLVQQAANFADTPAQWRTMLMAVLVHTTWGIGWTTQALSLPILVLAAPHASRGGGAAQALVILAFIALAAGPACSGHAISAPTLTATAVALDTVHMLAAGAWVGTLFAIAVVALPIARRHDDTSMIPLVARFSPIALSCAAMLVVTGTFAAWLHIGTIESLLASDYGQMLIRKLVLFAGVVLSGAYNWKVATPRLVADGSVGAMRRAVSIELLFAVVLVAVTAVLVATPLPSEL